MPITTSKEPWSTRLALEAVYNDNVTSALIADRDGNVIGYFRDHRDAEHVIEMQTYISELEAKVADQAITIEELLVNPDIDEDKEVE